MSESTKPIRILPLHLEQREITFTNLLLLDFNPAEMESKYGVVFNRDMFALPNKKAMEVVMHFLFTRLDPQLAYEEFRDCWPVRDKVLEQQFRKVCFNWVLRIQKEDPDAGVPRIVQSLFHSPGGERFYRFVMNLSRYVMVKVMHRDHGNIVSIPSFPIKTVHNKSFTRVMSKAMHAHFIVLKKRFLEFTQYAVEVERHWKEFAMESTKEYRSLVKRKRDLEHQILQLDGVIGHVQQGTNTGIQEEEDRNSSLEKIRDLWAGIDEFHSVLARQRRIVDSVLTGEANKFCIDASEIQPGVPDLLLRDCEREIERRNIEDVYVDGKVNLCSLIQLWNVCLTKIKEQLSQEPLPNFEDESQTVRSALHNHHADLTNVKSLRAAIQESLSAMKESIKDLKLICSRTLEQEQSKPSGAPDLFNLGLVPPTPSVSFAAANTPAAERISSLQESLRMSPDTVSTPDVIQAWTKSVKRKQLHDKQESTSSLKDKKPARNKKQTQHPAPNQAQALVDPVGALVSTPDVIQTWTKSVRRKQLHDKQESTSSLKDKKPARNKRQTQHPAPNQAQALVDPVGALDKQESTSSLKVKKPALPSRYLEPKRHLPPNKSKKHHGSKGSKGSKDLSLKQLHVNILADQIADAVATAKTVSSSLSSSATSSRLRSPKAQALVDPVGALGYKDAAEKSLLRTVSKPGRFLETILDESVESGSPSVTPGYQVRQQTPMSARAPLSMEPSPKLDFWLLPSGINLDYSDVQARPMSARSDLFEETLVRSGNSSFNCVEYLSRLDEQAAPETDKALLVETRSQPDLFRLQPGGSLSLSATQPTSESGNNLLLPTSYQDQREYTAELKLVETKEFVERLNRIKQPSLQRGTNGSSHCPSGKQRSVDTARIGGMSSLHGNATPEMGFNPSAVHTTPNSRQMSYIGYTGTGRGTFSGQDETIQSHSGVHITPTPAAFFKETSFHNTSSSSYEVETSALIQRLNKIKLTQQSFSTQHFTASKPLDTQAEESFLGKQNGVQTPSDTSLLASRLKQIKQAQKSQQVIPGSNTDLCEDLSTSRTSEPVLLTPLTPNSRGTPSEDGTKNDFANFSFNPPLQAITLSHSPFPLDENFLQTPLKGKVKFISPFQGTPPAVSSEGGLNSAGLTLFEDLPWETATPRLPQRNANRTGLVSEEKTSTTSHMITGPHTSVPFSISSPILVNSVQRLDTSNKSTGTNQTSSSVSAQDTSPRLDLLASPYSYQGNASSHVTPACDTCVIGQLIDFE